MNAHGENIDDLLGLVDPELVRSYGRNRLSDGMNLAQVNDKYKEVEQKLVVLARRHKMLLLCVVTMLPISFLASVFMKSPGLGIVLACILALGSKFIDNLYVRAEDRIGTLRHSLVADLKTFRNATEALKSPIGRTMREYTAASTRDNLITCAVRILDAEAKLDEVRFMTNRRLHDLVHYSNWLMRCQEEQKKIEEGIKVFGLKFDRSEIFAEARKHNARVDAEIQKGIDGK
ncbi:MAG: hypothetical protein WC027_00355 [Candidatus Paceibacterota bacterium]